MRAENHAHPPAIKTLLQSIRNRDLASKRKTWLGWAGALAGFCVILTLAGLEWVSAGPRSSGWENPFTGPHVNQGEAAAGDPMPPVLRASFEEAPALRRSRHRKRLVAKHAPAAPPEHAYCVRLCDGFFFPLGTIKANVSLAPQQGMCSQLCPAAVTRVFVTPGDSDAIGKAVAADGRSYSQLPVALHHTLETDDTCVCHAPNQAALVSMMNDFTLRPGDAVITTNGVKVFRGARHWPYQTNDFLGVANTWTSPSKKSTLMAIDRLIHSPRAARMEINQHFATAAAPALLPILNLGRHDLEALAGSGDSGGIETR